MPMPRTAACGWSPCGFIVLKAGVNRPPTEIEKECVALIRDKIGPVAAFKLAITVGRLPNGLRYWIRENREPKNRADLRLIVHAGSVLEDEDQRGLAHMVEHLAYNGSRHFPRQALVDFMESIGMRFGPDLNAFTGFDQTVYMLKIPMDSEDILEKSLLIMEDWAHGLTFDPALR